MGGCYKKNISSYQLYPHQNNAMKIKVLHLCCLGFTSEKTFLQIASGLQVYSLSSREHFDYEYCRHWSSLLSKHLIIRSQTQKLKNNWFHPKSQYWSLFFKKLRKYNKIFCDLQTKNVHKLVELVIPWFIMTS